MIRTRGLSHVQLAVDDVERAVRFYAEVFGFEVVMRRAGGALLQAPAGGGSIALEPGRDGEPLDIARFGLVLSDPRDLDTAVRLAVDNGGALIDQTNHEIGGATAVVADPSGHRITL